MDSPKMLLILVDETDMHGELPLYEAIVRQLMQQGIAGATVQAGIMGFGAHAKVHRKRLFGISDDRPVSIMAVDDEVKLRAILPSIRSQVKEGLILLADVEVIE